MSLEVLFSALPPSDVANHDALSECHVPFVANSTVAVRAASDMTPSPTNNERTVMVFRGPLSDSGGCAPHTTGQAIANSQTFGARCCFYPIPSPAGTVNCQVPLRACAALLSVAATTPHACSG